jgi:TPR repeat protein
LFSDWAEYGLGQLYEKGGPGLAQDYTQAIAWYRKAAANDNTDAQKALDNLRAKGLIPR